MNEYSLAKVQIFIFAHKTVHPIFLSIQDIRGGSFVSECGRVVSVVVSPRDTSSYYTCCLRCLCCRSKKNPKFLIKTTKTKPPAVLSAEKSLPRLASGRFVCSVNSKTINSSG